MESDKNSLLVGNLRRTTKEGRIKWEATPNTNEFTTSFKGKFSVVVSKLSDENYSLKMFDELDREMLSLEEGYRASLTAEGWLGLSDLFELARRSALKVDEALDDILEELQSF